FLRCPGSNLLGSTVRKACTPDMKALARVRGKVHPLSIRTPRSSAALRGLRTDLLSFGTPIKRRQPARLPAIEVHLHQKKLLTVGREKREVIHAHVLNA